MNEFVVLGVDSLHLVILTDLRKLTLGIFEYITTSGTCIVPNHFVINERLIFCHGLLVNCFQCLVSSPKLSHYWTCGRQQQFTLVVDM